MQRWTAYLIFAVKILKITQQPSCQSDLDQQMAWKRIMTKEVLWRDKHGSCVQLNVCKSERTGAEQRMSDRECERGGVLVQSLVPPALCTVLIHPSLASSNHSAAFPACGASQQHGASTWPSQVPGPLAWVNKASNKTNMGVTREIWIRICSFTQWMCRNLCGWRCTGEVKVPQYVEENTGQHGVDSAPFLLSTRTFLMLLCKDQGWASHTRSGWWMRLPCDTNLVHAPRKGKLQRAGSAYYAHAGVLDNDISHHWCEGAVLRSLTNILHFNEN